MTLRLWSSRRDQTMKRQDLCWQESVPSHATKADRAADYCNLVAISFYVYMPNGMMVSSSPFLTGT